MEIHVGPLQRTLNVAPGANLLDALRNNDVPISHSGMAGRCGTCRCKVVEGQVLDSGWEAQRPLARLLPTVLPQGERSHLPLQLQLDQQPVR